MKLLVLTRYSRRGASSRLRFIQYFSSLQSAGFEICFSPLFSDDYIYLLQKGRRDVGMVFSAYVRRLRKLFGKSKYDLLWIEKECLPWLPAWIETALLVGRTPYILDYDDAVFHLYDQNQSVFLRRFLASKHPALIRGASLVITGNKYLEDFASRHGASATAQLPTVVDINRYSVSVGIESEDRNFVPCVGWIGQTSTASFLEPLIPLFESLKRENLARFRLIGADQGSYGLPMECVEWSEETEVDSIRRMDIGIMPLTDGCFERGKCGYKLIQYMACGLPVVASPVGVNCEIVEHGVNGFLASNLSEWSSALRILLKDAALRARMGQAGRRKVELKYSLDVSAPRLIDLLRRPLER